MRTRISIQIDRKKLAKAKRVLRAHTDAQTVEKALDFVIANREIESAIDAIFGSLPEFQVS